MGLGLRSLALSVLLVKNMLKSERSSEERMVWEEIHELGCSAQNSTQPSATGTTPHTARSVPRSSFNKVQNDDATHRDPIDGPCCLVVVVEGARDYNIFIIN